MATSPWPDAFMPVLRPPPCLCYRQWGWGSPCSSPSPPCRRKAPRPKPKRQPLRPRKRLETGRQYLWMSRWKQTWVRGCRSTPASTTRASRSIFILPKIVVFPQEKKIIMRHFWLGANSNQCLLFIHRHPNKDAVTVRRQCPLNTREAQTQLRNFIAAVVDGF